LYVSGLIIGPVPDLLCIPPPYQPPATPVCQVTTAHRGSKGLLTSPSGVGAGIFTVLTAALGTVAATLGGATLRPNKIWRRISGSGSGGTGFKTGSVGFLVAA
jgi:hypothetical protein